MSPKLKPLILPAYVEGRIEVEKRVQDGELQYVYYTTNSSSSDLASPSPVTPTFSRGHSRYSGSTSSLEQVPLQCCDSPASPTQGSHACKNGKLEPQLPDVQEDPAEREGEVCVDESPDKPLSDYEFSGDSDAFPDYQDDLWNSEQFQGKEVDYDEIDLGFLSDNDVHSTSRGAKRRRATGSESPFGGWSNRIGSRFPALTRWRSNSKHSISHTFSAASEPSLDHRPSISRAASSRSSSISAAARRVPDRTNEPPLPDTTSLAFYDSTHDLSIPAALDIDKANVREGIERDRSMATTPLLPPLWTDVPPAPSQVQSMQSSPLQSPTVASSPTPDTAGTLPAFTLARQPLSSKPSVSSFGHSAHVTPSITLSPLPHILPLPPAAVAEVPSPVNLLSPQLADDEWSDRLGHANFIIMPQPYTPAAADLDTLRQLRADWDQARINYTKHLARTGEHYGITSNTYKLTEAKWADTDKRWRDAQDVVIGQIVALGCESAATVEWRRLNEDAPPLSPTAIPRMMLDAEKFPGLGDEDIVGPMQRDAFMMRDAADDKRGGAGFWKKLVGKVGRPK